MKCLFCFVALVATTAFAQEQNHNPANDATQRPPNPAAVAQEAAAQLQQSGGGAEVACRLLRLERDVALVGID